MKKRNILILFSLLLFSFYIPAIQLKGASGYANVGNIERLIFRTSGRWYGEDAKDKAYICLYDTATPNKIYSQPVGYNAEQPTQIHSGDVYAKVQFWLDEVDYVFIINTDSNGNGNAADWTLTSIKVDGSAGNLVNDFSDIKFGDWGHNYEYKYVIRGFKLQKLLNNNLEIVKLSHDDTYQIQSHKYRPSVTYQWQYAYWNVNQLHYEWRDPVTFSGSINVFKKFYDTGNLDYLNGITERWDYFEPSDMFYKNFDIIAGTNYYTGGIAETFGIYFGSRIPTIGIDPRIDPGELR